ncbi:MAG: ABC transporter ATP-binding protein [Lachnospiraceae bacterium]|nr:ABC transporter ATP-binding protein [Lachnospiraceae bacterium]MBR6271454.1 ABC transporter ATP-binding protein [Lachnospiraceae bacterium]
MIEVRGLVKSFGETKALDGADMNVRNSSVYGLVGPNGCGKTTMIKHLLGVLRQDAGTVSYDGSDIWENASIKQQIASIPDNWFFFHSATVSDMKKYYQGFYGNFSEERFKKLSALFDINPSRRISSLSKGMKKQVAFWITLSTMPGYLILDEPVDGLDPVMRRQIWRLLMDDVYQRGTTVLVSSHNLRELEDVCDFVGIMNNGKIEIERSLTKLQENMVKIQIVFPEEVKELPQGIPALHSSRMGRVYTLIMKMNEQEAKDALSQYEPLMFEALPLTLEEIFIYEMGGKDHDIKDAVL